MRPRPQAAQEVGEEVLEDFEVAGEEAAVGSRRRPEQVVATTLAALHKGRPSVVDGLRNRLLSMAPRLAPRRTTVAIAERVTRPRPA